MYAMMLIHMRKKLARFKPVAVEHKGSAGGHSKASVAEAAADARERSLAIQVRVT
jgi:hypothetical protein